MTALASWVIRWVGIMCTVVGGCFLMVLIATGSTDVGGYLAHLIILGVGVICYAGGHIMYATHYRVFRSVLGREVALAATGVVDLVQRRRSRRAVR